MNNKNRAALLLGPTGAGKTPLGRVSGKLAIFHERTAPLLQYYRSADTRVVTIEITATMTPEQMWEPVEQSRFAV